MTNALSWGKHRENLCSKLAQKLSGLRRIKQNVPQGLLSVIYQATIQPHIDYCVTVWGNAQYIYIYINKIQVLQNRAARIICNNFDWNVSASGLVKSHGWVGLALKKDRIILWVL